ncbi:MAG: tetratricopeptide repeat protein [Acidobacteriota bacterium]
MTRAATLCQACGAKVRADRNRCPRCRAHLVVPDAAAAAESSRRLGTAAVVVAGLFLVVVLGLWVTRGSEPSSSSAAPGASDPLADRRNAEPTPAPIAAPRAEVTEHSFVEAAGAGGMAYGAGDYAAALARYEEAVKKNPDDAESFSNLGQVLVRLNRAPEAIPNFMRAVEILPNRWAYHFNLARALGLTGRTEEAIASYRHAQSLFPDDYATAFNLAMTLHHAGDEAAAVEQYQKAIVLQPADASFRIALGISYEQLHKGPEAAAAYQEYLRLSPAAADADKVRARIARLTDAPAAAPVAAPTGG